MEGSQRMTETQAERSFRIARLVVEKGTKEDRNNRERIDRIKEVAPWASSWNDETLRHCKRWVRILELHLN